MADIDHELQRQLNQASAENPTVEAVIRLQGDGDQLVPAPGQVQQIAETVLNRVQNRVGYAEQHHHVFSNLGYFVVAADKDFIHELVAQPEVATAFANQRGDAPTPRPVKKSQAKSVSHKAK